MSSMLLPDVVPVICEDSCIEPHDEAALAVLERELESKAEAIRDWLKDSTPLGVLTDGSQEVNDQEVEPMREDNDEAEDVEQ